MSACSFCCNSLPCIHEMLEVNSARERFSFLFRKALFFVQSLLPARKTSLIFLSTIIPVLFISSGCSTYVMIGDTSTSAVTTDANGSVRYSLYPWQKEIRYQGFAFEWNKKDQFCVHPQNNRINAAHWTSRIPFEKGVELTASAYRYDPYLERNTIDALLSYARTQKTIPSESSQRLVKTDIRQTTFQTIPAVHCLTVTHDSKDNRFSYSKSYLFFDPYAPRILFDVSWTATANTEEQLHDRKLHQLGSLFFRRFHLLAPNCPRRVSR